MSGLTWTPLTATSTGVLRPASLPRAASTRLRPGERLVTERLEADGGEEAVVDGGQREAEAVDGDLDAAAGGIDADGALEGGGWW